MEGWDGLRNRRTEADVLEAIEEMRAAVAACRSTASTPDRSVSVTAGPANAILEISLRDSALRPGLGATIVTLARQAAAEAGAELAERSRQLTGGRIDVASTLAGELPVAPTVEETDAGQDGGQGDGQGDGQDKDEDAFEGAERIGRLVAGAREQAEAYAEVRAEVAELTGTVVSPDRGVSVTVRAGGTIEDIRIADAVLQQPAGHVARSVLSTIHLAAAEVARQTAERIRRVVGPGLDIEEMVAARGDSERASQGRQARGAERVRSGAGWQGGHRDRSGHG